MKRRHLFALLGASTLAPLAQARTEPDPSVLDLYLLRHGQTAWNQEKRLQGATDNQLNDTGRRQAAELAERLAGVAFAHVYSSGLQRARETAAMLAHGAPLTALPAFNERSFGRFEGIYEDDRSGGLYAEFARRAPIPDDALAGGESLQSQANRVAAAVREITARHRHGSIAIVSHGGVTPLILAALLELPLAEAVTRIRQANDEIYLVRLRPGTAPTVWKQIVRGTLEQL